MRTERPEKKIIYVFHLKKLLLPFFSIPGAIIVAMLAGAIWHIVKRRSGGFPLLVFSGLLYVLSVSFVGDFLMRQVEVPDLYDGSVPADSIILLGGGLVEGVRDLTGEHIPSPVMMTRIVDCVRLYNRYRFPVIVSGGVVGTGPAEAHVYRRFLTDLGVPADRIVVEDRSRDTVENARYVKDVLTGLGLRKSVLVTSSFHMRRATLIFTGEGVPVIPHACGAMAQRKKTLDMFYTLPNIHDLQKSALALRELAGLAFYSIKYAPGASMPAGM